MTKHNQLKRSDLFLVRMWTETTDTGSRLAYGKVQRAVSGETTHFEDWEGLLEKLRAMVANDRRSKQDALDKALDNVQQT